MTDQEILEWCEENDVEIFYNMSSNGADASRGRRILMDGSAIHDESHAVLLKLSDGLRPPGYVPGDDLKSAYERLKGIMK